MVSTHPKMNFNFSATFYLSSAKAFHLDQSRNLSSANAFNLDQSKNLSFGKGLNHPINKKHFNTIFKTLLSDKDFKV